MAEEKRSKGTDAPKCKVCGARHWGTCANQTPGGYLATTSMGAVPVAERLAKARAIVAAPPVTKRKNGKKR